MLLRMHGIINKDLSCSVTVIHIFHVVVLVLTCNCLISFIRKPKWGCIVFKYTDNKIVHLKWISLVSCQHTHSKHSSASTNKTPSFWNGWGLVPPGKTIILVCCDVSSTVPQRKGGSSHHLLLNEKMKMWLLLLPRIIFGIESIQPLPVCPPRPLYHPPITLYLLLSSLLHGCLSLPPSLQTWLSAGRSLYCSSIVLLLGLGGWSTVHTFKEVPSDQTLYINPLTLI